MPVDLNEQLTNQLRAIALEGCKTNQRLAMHTLLAFQKDLFSPEDDTAAILRALDDLDRRHRAERNAAAWKEIVEMMEFIRAFDWFVEKLEQLL